MKFTAPKDSEEFVLNSNDPIIQQMVIDTLRKNDINVYEYTKEFDPEYPVLKWDGIKLNQCRKSFLVSYDLKDFMHRFEPESHIHTLQLNDNYKAVVDLKEKTVKVGCQTFDFETINKLSELIKKEI